MVRFSYSVVVLSLVLMGCQQTKIGSKAPAAPAAQAAATPAPGTPGNTPVYPPGNPPGNTPVYPPGNPPGNTPVYPPGNPPGNTPVYPPPVNPTPVNPTPPVTTNEPPVTTYQPVNPPINPTNNTIPVNPPVGNQQPVTPVFQPPSIRDPEVVAPLPTAPSPGPGEQVFVPSSQPVPLPQTQIQPTQQPPALAQGGAKLPDAAPLPIAVPRAKPDAIAKPAPAVPLPTPVPRAKPEPKIEDPGTPVVSVDGTCGPVALDAQDKKLEDKLDVLFVVDTSASLRGGQVRGKEGELAQLASQMGNFVDAFPANMDIRIAVMLGHGKTHHTGRLFSAGKGDPVVLKVSDFGRDRARLARILKEKMQKVPNESGGAQGEALMYSLYQSVAKATLRNEIQKQDFYRADAALAVIMVTDEQDVCYDYKEDGEGRYTPVGKEVKNKKGEIISRVDKFEEAFLNGTCKTAGPNGTRLNHKVVYSALKNLKQNSKDDQKLMLFGLVYTDEKLTPKPGREDENEMGHGIIDLVGMQDAPEKRLADLNTVQEGPNKFGPELAFFANLAKKELESNGKVLCEPKDMSVLAIDRGSVVAQLQNEKGDVIGIFSESCPGGQCTDNKGTMRLQMRKDTRSPGYIQVTLDQTTLNKLLNAHHSKNNKVLFTFKTRTDRDLKTGAEVNPQTGKPIAAARTRR